MTKLKGRATSNKSDLAFGYDASGNRMYKLEKAGTDTRKWTYTWYVRDASGNVMATYKQSSTNDDNKEVFAITENIVYGSSRVGVKGYGESANN